MPTYNSNPCADAPFATILPKPQRSWQPTTPKNIWQPLRQDKLWEPTGQQQSWDHPDKRIMATLWIKGTWEPSRTHGIETPYKQSWEHPGQNESWDAPKPDWNLSQKFTWQFQWHPYKQKCMGFAWNLYKKIAWRSA